MIAKQLRDLRFQNAPDKISIAYHCICRERQA